MPADSLSLRSWASWSRVRALSEHREPTSIRRARTNTRTPPPSTLTRGRSLLRGADSNAIPAARRRGRGEIRAKQIALNSPWRGSRRAVIYRVVRPFARVSPVHVNRDCVQRLYVHHQRRLSFGVATSANFPEGRTLFGGFELLLLSYLGRSAGTTVMSRLKRAKAV